MNRNPAVIKMESLSERQSESIQSVELVDIIMEARDVVTRGRKKAQLLVEQAQTEADQLRSQAKDAGYKEGFEVGKAEGLKTGHDEALKQSRQDFEAKQKSLMAVCKQLISEINSKRAAWEAAARHDLVDLAMAIARRVAREVGDRDRTVILANLDEAVRLAGKRSEVTITTHPVDNESARIFAKGLFDAGKHNDQLAVIEDAEISPGGCRISWDSGGVDATLETQLDRIAIELRNGRVNDKPKEELLSENALPENGVQDESQTDKQEPGATE